MVSPLLSSVNRQSRPLTNQTERSSVSPTYSRLRTERLYGKTSSKQSATTTQTSQTTQTDLKTSPLVKSTQEKVSSPAQKEGITRKIERPSPIPKQGEAYQRRDIVTQRTFYQAPQSTKEGVTEGQIVTERTITPTITIAKGSTRVGTLPSWRGETKETKEGYEYKVSSYYPNVSPEPISTTTQIFKNKQEFDKSQFIEKGRRERELAKREDIKQTEFTRQKIESLPEDNPLKGYFTQNLAIKEKGIATTDFAKGFTGQLKDEYSFNVGQSLKESGKNIGKGALIGAGLVAVKEVGRRVLKSASKKATSRIAVAGSTILNVGGTALVGYELYKAEQRAKSRTSEPELFALKFGEEVSYPTRAFTEAGIGAGLTYSAGSRLQNRLINKGTITSTTRFTETKTSQIDSIQTGKFRRDLRAVDKDSTITFTEKGRSNNIEFTRKGFQVGDDLFKVKTETFVRGLGTRKTTETISIPSVRTEIKPISSPSDLAPKLTKGSPTGTSFLRTTKTSQSFLGKPSEGTIFSKTRVQDLTRTTGTFTPAKRFSDETILVSSRGRSASFYSKVVEKRPTLEQPAKFPKEPKSVSIKPSTFTSSLKQSRIQTMQVRKYSSPKTDFNNLKITNKKGQLMTPSKTKIPETIRPIERLTLSRGRSDSSIRTLNLPKVSVASLSTSKLIISPVSRIESRPKSLTQTRNILMLKPKTEIISKQKPFSFVDTLATDKVVTDTKTTQLLTPTYRTKIFTETKLTNIKTPTPTGTSLATPFLVPFGGYAPFKSVAGTGKRTKSTPTYAPSIVGITLNIKAPKQQKENLAGFGIRGV